MKHITFVIAVALIFSASAGASDSPSTILERDGKLSPPRLAAFVASVEPSIREWPPRFRDERHESQVRSATSRVVSEINAVDLSGIRDQAVLTNIAHTLSMAHNIDLGSGPKAKETFERAIALNPDSRRTNYLFGMFLISTTAYHFESLPFLEKAYSLGEKDALFSIGLLLVRKGEKTRGLEALDKYANEHPDSAHTRKVIAGIKDGSLTFREK